MNILLLNAGSSSLKTTLVEVSDGRTLASGLADWAGSETRYRFTGPDGNEPSEEVSWKGHAQANGSCRSDADVTLKNSRARILVIATREGVTMLREVMHVLGGERV